MFTPRIEKLSPECVSKLDEVKKAMSKIPEMSLPSGRNLSCHIVCRIVSKMLRTPYKDGYFKPYFEHSWLEWRHYIIDPYPIGVFNGPLILETSYGLIRRSLYEEVVLETTLTREFQKDFRYAFAQTHWKHIFVLQNLFDGDSNTPHYKCKKCGVVRIGKG